MKELRLIFTLTIFSSISSGSFCQVDSVETVNLMVISNPQTDGMKYVKTGETAYFTGIMFDYYPRSKKIAWTQNITEGTAKNSVLKNYYSSGQLKSVQQYGSKGIEEGDYAEWDEDGILKISGKYHDGAPYGNWIYYNSDGSIKEEKKQ